MIPNTCTCVCVCLLQQIQHPTASLIAKVATAQVYTTVVSVSSGHIVILWVWLQDDITGDGTTSNVLIIGELLKQADLYISEVWSDSHLLYLAVMGPHSHLMSG